MTVGEMDDLDFLVVEEHRNRMIESDYRQGFFGLRRSRAFEEFRNLFRRETLAYVGMGDNRSFAAKGGIRASVIPMIMGVQDKLQFAFAKRLQCRFDLVCQRRKLIVYNQDPIRSD